MSAYINELRAKDAVAHTQRAKAEAVRERLTPLEERLTRLLATIPIEVQCEGLSQPLRQIDSFLMAPMCGQ